MQRVQQLARRQQRIEELCGAAVRALTGLRDVHIRARGLYRGHRRIAMHAPHLRADPERDELIDHRGAADGMALRLSRSDAQLHRSLCPQASVQRLIFELLEQLRVESLVPDHLPGVTHNLIARFEGWSRTFHHVGLSDSALGLLLYTVAQMCWSRLNGRPVLAETEDFIEATRAGIAPFIGRDLAGLKRHRANQQAYAGHALAIAASIDQLIGEAQAEQSRDLQDADDDEDHLAAFKLLLDFDEGDDRQIAIAASGQSKVLEAAETVYRVFDRQFDREIDAATLVRPALLRDLRERLDALVREQGVNITRLSRQLAALFAEPTRDDWSFGKEEGRLDGRRLAQLVSSPTERRLFQQERFERRPNTLLSLLIDCSGSMKEHIEKVAVLIDVLGRALQQAGVATEILGYTTGAWNGGRVQLDWLAKGRPMNPGRLNEVNYLVYKDAATNWRRARPVIAAMLKPDLFREGVDGEAIEWACGRMIARDEARRVLVVISDGCPMDTATKLANDEFYLANHLQQVVARLEQQSDIEIYGLGVGLDLSPYYSQCLALDLAEGQGNQMFAEILQLLGGRHRR